VLAIGDVDEARAVRQRAKPNHVKSAAKQRMTGIHDLDQVVVCKSGRIDRGINM